MANINKFIISLSEEAEKAGMTSFCRIIDTSLRKQNLEIKNGRIVSTIWCVCLDSMQTAYRHFDKNVLYRYCPEIKSNLKKFRFATEEEMKILLKGED